MITTHDFNDGNGPVAAHKHVNPGGSEGGWVAETATVAPTAYVGPNARVYGDAVVYGALHDATGNFKPYGAQHLPGLGKDPAARKAAPIASGLLFYFPNACAAVANLSKIGNEQHNPGQPMHWAFDKSSDEADCITRHLAQSGTVDTDGILHSAKVAWRALALLERELLAANPEMQPGKNVKGFKR